MMPTWPEDPAAPKLAAPSWISRNYIALLMLVGTIFLQVFNAGGWLHDQQHTDADIAAKLEARQKVEAALGDEINQFRLELHANETIYVRQDVFNQVMQRIDERLKAIADAQRGR